MRSKYIYSFLLILYIGIFGCLNVSASPTASEIMNKAGATLKSAKGISGKFTLISGKNKLSGNIKVAGSKFAIESGASSSWYNGKQMWTYNPTSKETTLVIPTPAEINETNPLEYIKGYSNEYTASFASQKLAGKYSILLTPKKKRNTVKSVILILNSKTLKPEKLTVTMKSGTKSDILINSLDYNSALKSSDFEYPKSRYPKIPIVDLR